MSARRHMNIIAALGLSLLATAAGAQDAADAMQQRLDRLERQIRSGEDIAAIKRLQRIYGYYLDKGMWTDLAALFADDAVANYPAGVYIGKDSITRHLYLNVGAVELGENGLGDGRLYDHMNLQPVVQLDPGGQTAQGRWRAMAMFGRYGTGGATWAEGVYEMGYVKQDGVWKIRTLDYHAGFGAPYATGWVDSGAPRGRRRPPLPHPPDRARDMPCEGFPDACIAPFHYENPGSGGAAAWTEPGPLDAADRGDPAERTADLVRRATRLADEQAIENLIRIYGYYLDRRSWDQVADLFADEGTIEIGLRGIYAGKERIRAFLDLLGPEGLSDGELNDRAQLQIVVSVADDGQTARSRSREFGMTGDYGGDAFWSAGIYENTFVKQDGVWKIRSLRFYPTFITDYDRGWVEDARAPAGVSAELPPDRPPSEVYGIYPKAHIPPYHYANPVTGLAPTYPRGDGRPSRRAIRAATAPVEAVADVEPIEDIEAAVAEAERLIARIKDYHELYNLQNAYGYYLDKNLWNDLADLFADDGSMELAQRGAYVSRERVRGFLFAVFGPEGPVEGRLGNHLQMQPVIHVAADGRRARIRSRMLQQLNFGPRASMGAAIYENEAINEDGVWKFSSVHAFNTWTAAYDGGWAENPGRRVPGPSASFPPDAPPSFTFEMFPNVYDLPFHYDNPVSGRASTRLPEPPVRNSMPDGIPPDIAAELREIGARIEPARTGAIYAPLQAIEPYDGVLVARDLHYGPHERHVLDVFRSPDADGAKPVIVFVHGGGFTRGAKTLPGLPFYDNVMLWAVAEGAVGVDINYRLAPEHQWPSGVEDLSAVVAWLQAHIADYGGAADQIFLWGHSAGAAHVADYLASRVRNGDDATVAGAILTSGFYDLGDEVSAWQAYYGDDVSTYAERSSLPALARSTIPLFVSDAELDPENFRIEADKLAQARADAGRPVRRLHLPGHSHISETYAIGTADTSLSAPVIEFVRGVAAARD